MSAEPDKSLDIVDVETCPAYDDEDYRYYVEFMFKTSDGAWHDYWLPEDMAIKLVDYLLNELWQFDECRKNATLPISGIRIDDLGGTPVADLINVVGLRKRKSCD